jgi:hypothetical protein
VAVEVAPLVSVGLTPADDRYALTAVRWAVLADDSLLVIGDLGAKRVGVYGLDGLFRTWLGRVGEGPGEFKSPRAGGLTSNGKVWIFDPNQQRVLLFRPDGELIETIRIQVPENEAWAAQRQTVVGVDSAGGIWLQLVIHPWELSRSLEPGAARRLLPGERYRPSVMIRRFVADSSTLVWRGEGDETVFEPIPGANGWASGQLAPRLLTTLMADRLLLTRTDSSSLEVVSPRGIVHPWMDYPLEKTPIGDRFPEYTGPHRYDYLPEALAFIPGALGTTWLAIRNPSDVFHPLVHLSEQGAVEYLDPGQSLYYPAFVGEDFAVALDSSDLGVQYVSVHRLLRN